MSNTDNLRPFNTLPPEEHRELSRRGGVASGERRREIADIKTSAKIHVAALYLVEESRAEYRRAIKRYVKDERKKAARRKKSRPK
ncbi:hypothetical protein [uncultured Dysosmobacter sp.]|uniref:hypothetical protein n=1 Tax=uncultured Dysosmobacter sp. TaxID=2591384 RepID=UPI00267336EA|nr:hypothetical protein [uncultured Dysosmobacter sp.]